MAKGGHSRRPSSKLWQYPPTKREIITCHLLYRSVHLRTMRGLSAYYIRMSSKRHKQRSLDAVVGAPVTHWRGSSVICRRRKESPRRAEVCLTFSERSMDIPF